MSEDTARAEWLAWRREGIGASDVAAILGISRWSSRWTVWAEKVGLLPLDHGGDNPLMEAGRYLERAVGPWFADRMGVHVAGEQDQITHPQVEWARATIDGLVFEGPGSEEPLGNLEIKTAQPGPVWDNVPPDYLAQAYWQQYVGGYERTYFAVLAGRTLWTPDEHPQLIVERDDNEIEFLANEVRCFWDDFVCTGDPPEIDGTEATRAALTAVYGEQAAVAEGSVLDATHEAEVVRRLIAERAEAAEAKKYAEERYESLSNQLRSMVGDHEELHLNGHKVVSWKWQTRNGLDVAGVQANHPRIAKKFAKPSRSRVLRIHKEKK